MKTTILIIAAVGALVFSQMGWAQDATSALAAGEPKLSADQLDDLVAPIALYPDPLIAIILPASTVPSDVVLAARYLRDGKDADQIDNQSWDPSVKALARYPDVLNTMDENLDWTNQLGAAVLAQQDDVMQAIQTQRAKANALGNLTTTPQQQVIVENQVIQIVPADPQIIYVPQYNPQVVYVQQAPAVSPFITFGLGFAMGAWLTNDCDWYHHRFYVNTWGPGGWHGYSRYNYNNNVNININNNNNYWKPNPNRPPPRPPYNPNHPGGGGASTLPAFRPPPTGGGNGGNRPGGGNGNSGGINRPGGGNGGNGNGSRPSFPSQPGTGGGNGITKPGQGGSGGNGNTSRPNFPAQRPGTGGESGVGKPSQGGNGQTKPAPTKPTTRPSTPENQLPNLGGQNNRAPKEATKPTRPATSQSRPAQQRPATTQQQRPAAQPKSAPQRPAAAQGGGGGQRQGLSR